MAINRTAVYAALYARMKSTVQAAKTFSTRPDWEGAQPSDLPLVMVVPAGQTPGESDGFPEQWRVTANILIKTPDLPGAAGSDLLLKLIDQVCGALDRQPREFGGLNAEQSETTLGDVCRKAYVSGKIEMDLFVGEPGFAYIPVEMLVIG